MLHMTSTSGKSQASRHRASYLASSVAKVKARYREKQQEKATIYSTSPSKQEFLENDLGQGKEAFFRTQPAILGAPAEGAVVQLNKADFESICSRIESGELERTCASQALRQAVQDISKAPQQKDTEPTAMPPRPPGMALPEEVTLEMKAMQWKEPQKWSLTMRQFCTIVEHCMGLAEYVALKKQKRFITMYDLCNIFVKSWSAGTGKCVRC